MKKTFLLAALLSTFFTFSQEGPVRLGVQAGVNYSRFWGYELPEGFDQIYTESGGIAYLAGVSVEYDLTEKWSFRAELNYERKTTQADESIELVDGVNGGSQIYDYTSQTHYDYLVLPLLFKYRFTEKNSFFLNGGPFVGFLLQSKITHDLDYPGVDNELTTTDNHKAADAGLSIGLGKEFNFGSNKSMHIEIRNNLGLTDINKGPLFFDGNIKTNSLNLILGLRLW